MGFNYFCTDFISFFFFFCNGFQDEDGENSQGGQLANSIVISDKMPGQFEH